jgi:hypothetical protein
MVDCFLVGVTNLWHAKLRRIQDCKNQEPRAKTLRRLNELRKEAL